MDAGSSVPTHPALIVVALSVFAGCNEGALGPAPADAAWSPDLAAGDPNVPIDPAARTRCSPDRWCWENPLPAGDFFHSAFAAGPDDIWIGSEAGAILRRRAGAWERYFLQEPVVVNALWGGCGGDVWAFGDDGSIERYHAGAFTTVRPHSTKTYVSWAVAGRAADDVLATWTDDGNHEYGTVHWDGTTWADLQPFAEPLVALSATCGGDLIAIDRAGAAWRFDGRDWTAFGPPLSDGGVQSVWGAAPNDVWLGGGKDRTAVLWHFDGHTTKNVPVDLTGTVDRMWGRAGDDAFARVYGSGPLGVAHWNGAAWSMVLGGEAPPNVPRPYIFGGDGAWAVGEDLWLFDGTTFEPKLEGARPIFTSIWASDDGDAWVVGRAARGSRTTIAHWDGRAWQMEERQGTYDATDVVRGTGRRDVWIAGSPLLHFDGNAWSAVESPTGNALRDVWPVRADEVWAVDEYGDVAHFDGSRWTTVRTPLFNEHQPRQMSVFASAAGDVWVGDGEASLVRGRVDAPFVRVELASYLGGYSLFGVGPDIWLVDYFRSLEGGIRGSDIYHYQNGTFRIVPCSSSAAVFAVAGSATGDVWLVGDDVRHWDGRTLKVVEVVDERPGWRRYSDLTVHRPDDVWAVGDEGLVGHWDGKTWTEQRSGTGARLVAVAAVRDDIVAVGWNGAILRHRP